MTSILSTDTPMSSRLQQVSSQVVMKGANGVNEIVQTAGTTSSGQTTFTFQPLDVKSILDLRWELEMSLTVISSKAAGGNVSRIGKICPRSFALNSIITSCQIVINGHQLETQSYVVKQFLQNMDVSDDILRNSLAYGDLDRCSNYKLEKLYTEDNVFLGEAASSRGLPSRGAYPFTLGGVDAATATVTDIYVLREPLLHGLLKRGIEEYGLSNIRNVQVTLIHSNMAKAFSIATDANFDTIAVSVTAGVAPILHLRYETPNVPVPDMISVPWVKYEPQIKNLPSIANGASQIVTSDNIQMTVVPDKIVIFVPQNLQNKGAANADGFLCIDAISISVGQATNRMAGATPFQLWQMSVRNGLKMTWDQWSRRLGSILVIDVANDIGGFIAGTQISSSIRVQLTIANRDYTAFNNSAGYAWDNTDGGTLTINYSPQMFVVLVSNGRLEVSPNFAASSVGFDFGEAQSITESETHLSYDDVKGSSAEGSMTGSSFKDFVRGVTRAVGHARNGLRTVNREANPILNQLAAVDPRFGNAAQVSNKLQGLVGKSLLLA